MAQVAAVPADWTADNDHKVYNYWKGASATVKIEAVGNHFQVFTSRRSSNRTLSEHERIENENSTNFQEDEELSEDEEETFDMLDLDPKDWKNQDHYVVLGISRLRHKATDEDLKKAFRKKVLRHHPDKKAQSGGSVNDDNLFKCIQKAFEVLSNPTTRLHFDSVDPTFDESIPSDKEVSGPNFFKVLGPIFQENARFSKKKPVPLLGDDNSTEAQVNRFYDFWYNFDSWRIFNYLDEEEAQGDNRGDKRYIEKKNLKARAERKKEDNARIRMLTDLALKHDPRLKKFKDQEKEKKAAKEAAKKKQENKQVLAAQKEKEKELEAQAKLEEEKKKKVEEEKKEKEARKNNLRKFRKNIRQLVKDQNYFLAESFGATSKEAIDAMVQLEKVCEEATYENLERLSNLSLKDPHGFEVAYREQQALFFDASSLPPMREVSDKPAAKETAREWTDEEQVLLIQAIKLFPGGTTGRWDKIAAHINEHSKQPPRSAREATTQANEIKKTLDQGKVLELEANKITKKHNDTLIKDAPTQRTEDAASASTKEEEDEGVWTKEEQATLEKALRDHPASEGEARWDNIAAKVGTKTKKQCKVRCKKLSQQIKDKKGGK